MLLRKIPISLRPSLKPYDRACDVNLIIRFSISYQKCIIFALTVPVLLPFRSANGSFYLKVRNTNNNTPSMPLYDAHLGGFFFYTPINE